MSGFVVLVAGEAAGPPTAELQRLCAGRAEGEPVQRLQRPGLSVWTWGEGVPVRAIGPCLIVGALDGGAPAAGAWPTGTRAQAERLLQTTWGRYVAILRGGDGAFAVLRDPSGALELQAWRRAGMWVLASGLEHLPPKLWPEDIALDWDAIVEGLQRPLAGLARTPLHGVRTVSPGALLQLGDPPISACLWRPRDWADRPPQGDPAPVLAATVTDVVARMTRDRRVLVEVSGGLDSAVVAACWAATGQGRESGLALNYYGDRPEGDERAWAKALCEAVALRLMTQPLRPRPWREADFAELADGARPAFAALDAGRDRRTASLVRRLGAKAILTGGGGDATFFQAPTAKVIVDYLAAHGAGHALDPFVQGVARRLGRSVWSVLWDAAARPRLAAAPASRFLRRAAWTAPGPPGHPWLDDLEDLPPAKRMQIRALAAQQEGAGRSRRSQAAPLLQPLLAQPVLELCLSIPAWGHVAGGADRALARRAFADRLPPALVARQAKGSLTSLYARQAAVSLEALRPWLLDGALARAGVLDREAVASALTPERLLRDAEGAALVRVAAVEAWVRHWQTRIPDLRARHR